MSGHTKGRVGVVAGKLLGFDLSVVDSAGDAELGNWLIAGVCGEERANLIAEAFNVAHETCRTPAQLAAERAELVAALAELVSAIEAEVNAKGAGGFLLARLTDARTILAKVKGPVPS